MPDDAGAEDAGDRLQPIGDRLRIDRQEVGADVDAGRCAERRLGDPLGADDAQVGDGQEPAAPQGVRPGDAGNGHREHDDGDAHGHAEQAERPAEAAEPAPAPALARDEGGARRHIDRPAGVLVREEQGQLRPPSTPTGAPTRPSEGRGRTSPPGRRPGH